MKGATTCLLLLVTLVNVFGAPIGTCSSQSLTSSTNALLADSYNCSVYYSCSSGSLVQHACPSELHFNSVSQVCESPSSAGCQPSTSQTDLPTNTLSEANTDAPKDSTTDVPIEQTTEEFTTECLVTGDGIEISTEYTTAAASELVDHGETTFSTDDGTVYISTDIAIEISTTTAPIASEFVSGLQTEEPGNLNAATDPESKTGSITTAQVAGVASSGEPGSNVPGISSISETATPLITTNVLPAEGIENTPVAPSASPSGNEPLVSHATTANQPATDTIPEITTVVLETDAPAEGVSSSPGIASFSSLAELTAGPSANLGGGTASVTFTSPAPLTPALSDAAAQSASGPASAPASSVSGVGLKKSPAVTSSDSPVQSAPSPSSQSESVSPAASSDIPASPARSDAAAQSASVPASAPASSVSGGGLENLPAVTSSDSPVQSAASPSGQSENVSPAASSDISASPALSDAAAQSASGPVSAPASSVSAGGLENLPAVTSSDSPVQSAASPSGQSENVSPAASSDIPASPALSDAAAQSASGPASAPASSVSGGGLENLPAVTSSDSPVQSAASLSGQSENVSPAASSDIPASPALSDAAAQSASGPASAPPASSVSAGGLANLPAVTSSDSPVQSAALSPGQSVNGLSIAGSVIPPAPAAPDATAQWTIGSASAAANSISADGLANLLSILSSYSPPQSAVLPADQSVNGLSIAYSGIPTSAAVADAAVSAAGPALAPVNSVLAVGLANLPAIPSQYSPAQSTLLSLGQPVSVASSGVALYPAASGATAQPAAWSAFVPTNYLSADVLASLPAAAKSYLPAQSALWSSIQPGNVLSTVSSGIPPNPSTSDGHVLAPESAASPDALAKPLPVPPPVSFVQPAVQTPGKPEIDIAWARPGTRLNQAAPKTTPELRTGAPVAPKNDVLPPGTTKASSDAQRGFHIRIGVGSPADTQEPIVSVPIPIHWPYLATRLPGKPFLDATSKITFKDDLQKIKADLKQKLKSDIEEIIENIPPVPYKQVTKPVATTTTRSPENYKKAVKEFIKNVTKILNELPNKSQFSKLNLPQFSSKDYNKLVKEFVSNVTISLESSNSERSRIRFTKHLFSVENYKRLVKEFIANITAIHNQIPTTPKPTRPTTAPADRRRKYRPQPSDALKIDNASESDESEESSASRAPPSPKLRRPTTVHPRFEWVARTSQKREEKKDKQHKHSKRESAEKRQRKDDSDED